MMKMQWYRNKQTFIFCILILLHLSLQSAIPFFEAFPSLAEKISYISIADLPTPVMKMDGLGAEIGYNNLYIKRDDLSGKMLDDGARLFGENKIRKLEFLLGDALSKDAQAVITFGAIGSNHVVATAASAHDLGLKSYSVLWAMQPNSSIVRRNLALMDYYDTEIHFHPDARHAMSLEQTYDHFTRKFSHDTSPYMIPMGGSCSIGELGYINAAFELKDQIAQGLMPEPDRLYVCAGSFGTIAGLLLGVKLAGLKTNIIGITIQPERIAGKFKETIANYVRATNMMLHNLDASIPLYDFCSDDVQLLFDYAGEQYGLVTAQAEAAIALVKEKEDVILDYTYTGKTMAGMIDDTQKYAHQDEVILFWNTFYGDMCDDAIAHFDFTKLPQELQIYFQKALE